MPSYMDQMYGYYYDEMTLSHHGVLGQRWGVRRYQNADGSLTDAGKKRVASYRKDSSFKKDLAKRNNSDALRSLKSGKLASAYLDKSAATTFNRLSKSDSNKAAKIERASIKAQYKNQKKSIKDTRNKLLDKDDEKIEDDYGKGKISYWEASRRSGNSENLRYEQARARRLAAKSEMNAKLAENSTGISKSIREAKAKHEAKRAELWSKEASKTKKMINITNDVFKNRVSTGERIASELFMTDEVRNRYYLNRANMSAARSLGKTVMENIMDYPYYA